MNQNYVNLIQFFLREECKNMFLKEGSMFLSEAFQFIIEKWYIQINYSIVTI